MADDSLQFQTRLFGTFLKEAQGHVAEISTLLDSLEKTPGQADTMRDLLREVHSLKGAAGAVEQSQVEFLCRSLEQATIKVQRGERAADAIFFEVFRHGLQLLESGLAEVSRGGTFTVSLHFLENVRKLTWAS